MKRKISKKKRQEMNYSFETLSIVSTFPCDFTGYDLNRKINRMLRNFSKSYDSCKKELKGIFTLNEAWFLISAFNGIMYSEKMGDKDQLIAIIEDASYYEYMDQQCDVSKKDFIAKISSLTEFQCFTVMFMAYEFWSDSETLVGDAVDEFVKQIFMIEDQK